MNRDANLEMLAINAEIERRRATRKLFTYYPETGSLRRELYPKHLQFFAAGNKFMERLFLAANRIGKTEGAGGYETTLHLTGLYPDWWPGKRFSRAIDAWGAGDTSETVRDVIQLKLLGNVGKDEIGTGLIPKDHIVDISRKRGVSDSVDTVFVKHVSGGVSQMALKSYDQKRKAFQGTKKDLVWLDEEPELDVYTECLLRLMGTSGNANDNGIMLLTFTPLLGMSETVMSFLPGGAIEERSEGEKFVVMGTWDDVPHLTAEAKEKLWNSIPPFQRDARSKGIPQLGAGAIYQVPESDIVVSDFEIPPYWPRCFGMDVGWNRTAVVWGAIDPESDVLYLYSEHYRGEAEPVVHAESIKSRGEWVPGVIDPASRGRSQKDGLQLFQMYCDLGLDLEIASNAVESGIYEVWQRMSTGRLKVFKSLSNWLFEFRLYRRDEKGRIVKQNDHAMDAMRYLVMSGIERAKAKPAEKQAKVYQYARGGGNQGWMG